MENKPKRRGDRRDGYLVRNPDPMHIIMPFILGERIENEAVMFETFDMTQVDNMLNEMNAQNPEHKYTYFHLIVAALLKTVYLRPKMNRYVCGHRYYDRDNISISFTVKNKMSDNSDESLIMLVAEEDDNILEQVHQKICKEAYKIKKENTVDNTTQQLNWLTKVPRWLLKLIVKFANWLNYHDWLPKPLYEFDPYRSTIYISNLGSIKTSASYHHLTNWSKTGIFVLANQCKKVPFFHDDGTYEMKNSMGIGFTIDERIADGFYFARSIDVFKYIIEHPEVLKAPISSPIDFPTNNN